MKIIYLDLCSDYIPLVVQCTDATGAKTDPSATNLIVYEELGADTNFDATEIASSPFTPAKINAKTGYYGNLIAKSELTAGRFYLALWEMTVDSVTTAKIERFFVVNSSQMKADVSAVATEANATSNTNSILSAINAYPEINVSGE